MNHRRAIARGAAAAALLASFLALPLSAGLYVDLRWYEALGHADVFTTPLLARLGLGTTVGVLTFVLLALDLKIAAALSRGRPEPMLIGRRAGPLHLDAAEIAGRLAVPGAALVSLLTGLMAAGSWRAWLMFTHAHAFGDADPLFGRDVGFYVFTLPLLDALFPLALSLLLVALASTTALYALRGAIGFEDGRLRARRPARVHLSVLGAALFGVLAYGAWLSTAHLVVSQEGLVAGAGYTDVHARLPMIRAHLAAAIVGAVLIAVSATRRRLVLAYGAVGLYAAMGLFGRGLYPALTQKYVVEPNELDRERPFIEREITATRAAYGLSGVGRRELDGDLSLSWSEVQANRDTVGNIRLWDHRPLLDTFGQIQEIRTYYDFVSVDNDRYRIEGQLRQTMLSPRELSAASLPNRTWINEHFTFTHGYGLTLGPVNEADAEGLPVLFVKDIPPVSTVDHELEVRRPQIYFGELSNEYVFVHTADREFDHPSADENVYASYEGRAGIELSSQLARMAVAAELGSFKVLLSDDLRDDSRVLLHREVRERVSRLAPFLTLDGDPYLVVRDDGSLCWILDAYTHTDRYPYSRQAPGERLSYVRNSVKAVVDAYDGTVTLYTVDEDDPILATWRSVFPGLLTPLEEMPADLRAHLRYPVDIFEIQTRMLATFHMDSPELLYNREDQWQVPTLRRGRSAEAMEPYYTVMSLPGEDAAEFILMLPFTPARKDNLAAWVVGRSDGAHLGELVVYEFPNDRLVYGPEQVLNRINQDADISAQLSLWDQRGSEADFGTLLVIPIEESLIYVLPLYLRSEGGRIPQLKRVIVVYENRIAMRETLPAALAEVFGQGAPELGEEPATAVEQEVAEGGATPEPPPQGADPRAAALRYFDRAVAAQRRGDWAGYGEELRELGRALRAMQPDAGVGSTGSAAGAGTSPDGASAH